MTKKRKAVCILLVIAGVFSVIAFVAPFPLGGTFWIAYLAGILAIILQIPVFKIAFDGTDEYKSKILGFPIFRIGYFYLVIQMLVSFTLFLLSFISIPPWIALIFCVLVLSGAIFCSISADIAREEIQKIEEKSRTNTNSMIRLKVMSKNLNSKTDNPEFKKIIKKIFDSIRFSDPVSNSETFIYEESIKNSLIEIESALKSDDRELVIKLCDEILQFLEERNEVCKMSKFLSNP